MPAALGMSLKSSLPVCWLSSAATSPKLALKADDTRRVVASSLSVSGKLSNVSKSGSRGEPDAWHSAVTIGRIAVSMHCGHGCPVRSAAGPLFHPVQDRPGAPQGHPLGHPLNLPGHPKIGHGAGQGTARGPAGARAAGDDVERPVRKAVLRPACTQCQHPDDFEPRCFPTCVRTAECERERAGQVKREQQRGSVMTANMPYCLAGYDPGCGASQARAAAVRASVPVRRVGCSTGRNFGEWLAGRSFRCPFFSAVRYVRGSVPPMAQ